MKAIVLLIFCQKLPESSKVISPINQSIGKPLQHYLPLLPCVYESHQNETHIGRWSRRGLSSSAWLFKKDPTNSMLSKKNQAAWPFSELQRVLLSPQQIQSKIAKCGYIVTHLEKPCRHKFFLQNTGT